MIAALALALGVASAAVPESLLVRGAGRAVAVPVTRQGGERVLRADLLANALDGSVTRLDATHFRLALPGVEFALEALVPFARAKGEVVPLVPAPYTERTRLFVPLQLAADLLPRLGSGVLYDADRGELRVFSTAAGSRRRPDPPATPVIEVASPPARTAAPVPVTARTARPAEKRLVVVDAGHGGPDRGMNGPLGGSQRLYEKTITLAVAQKVAAALRDRGVDVLMTRTTDTLIALYDRGRIANAAHAALFVSIHVNAANPRWREPSAARGFETYFLAEAKTEEESRVEQMENEAVRFETGANAPKGDPLSFIINDMAQNEHLRESNELATAIQRSLGRIHPGPSRGVKQANFAVLRTSFMPAVLVEIGFGTNPSEARFLNENGSQSALADAIATATMDYLGRYDRRVRVSGR